MKYIKLFDTTSDMNAAIANSTVGFLGMANNNGNPVINNVPEPAPNTITVNTDNMTDEYTYSYAYPGEIEDMTLQNFSAKVITDHPECLSSGSFSDVYLNNFRITNLWGSTLAEAGVVAGDVLRFTMEYR